MSGFKGFTNDPQKDGNVRFEIDTSEVLQSTELETQIQNDISDQNENSEENQVHSSPSNGLENFDIEEEDTLELFNSENSENKEEVLPSLQEVNKDNEEEDELEIPAFLRRQKN